MYKRVCLWEERRWITEWTHVVNPVNILYVVSPLLYPGNIINHLGLGLHYFPCLHGRHARAWLEFAVSWALHDEDSVDTRPPRNLIYPTWVIKSIKRVGVPSAGSNQTEVSVLIHTQCVVPFAMSGPAFLFACFRFICVLAISATCVYIINVCMLFLLCWMPSFDLETSFNHWFTLRVSRAPRCPLHDCVTFSILLVLHESTMYEFRQLNIRNTIRYLHVMDLDTVDRGCYVAVRSHEYKQFAWFPSGLKT